MTKTWKDPYLDLIKDCEQRESQLNDWEIQFLDSITHQLHNNKKLSTKQIEKLDTIWERVTAHG